jgi:tRNA (adenine37-N6)-methyltransferase
MALFMEPIGYVRGGRVEATKDQWGSNLSRLELLEARFSTAAVSGLEQVSHVEVIFYFHLFADEPVELGARRPRNRLDWPKVGIFAQHGRMRPNRLGVSICQVVRVNGLSIEVQGLDAVDGTPLLDIKPVWSGYLPRGPVREPEWVQQLMASYW